TWTATGNMIEARAFPTATLLPDGRVLVAGGSLGLGGLASAELYDPGSGSWTATGNMIEGRGFHTATLLPDGTVLVAGGIGLSTAELYDPGSGSWTATGNMIEARAFYAATRLPDGKVLVAGGRNSGTSAELYDPGSGTWTVTASMIEARSGHTATLLSDVRVLVAGGEALGSAEVYEPGSGTAGGIVTPRCTGAASDPPGCVAKVAFQGITYLDHGYVALTDDARAGLAPLGSLTTAVEWLPAPDPAAIATAADGGEASYAGAAVWVVPNIDPAHLVLLGPFPQEWEPNLYELFLAQGGSQDFPLELCQYLKPPGTSKTHPPACD
ncbi:MAG: kelch-like protein, partial [Gemmatimonadales bacterium]